ncbi:hypothetical protein P3T76_011216 [Phytophthora citrophthora]|uniref:Acyltransferase 3 domain-containing protein n=1 Tax=Phytophthora citrophthora TaxID=4793 RepID=A0AAD9GA55_9STRA|nr:hypothetical protein P3T76_011216 [Phytophthora citrophthora]
MLTTQAKDDSYNCTSTTYECDKLAQDSPPRQHCIDATTAISIQDGGDLVDVEIPKKTKEVRSGKVTLKFLNGLRGVASLMVVHHHARYLQETTIAPSGVDIFFVLSAFLLTMINEAKISRLIQRKEGPRQWAITLLGYFIKRVLRVYPLFASVAFALTCMPEATRTHYYNLEHYHIQHWSLWDILTFKRRYYLFWTMPIEITYYFIIPVFLTGVCLLGRFKWVVIAPLYVWVYYEGGHTDRGGHGEFRPHLSTFVTGSLAGVVYLELKNWMKEHNFELRLWQLLLVRAVEILMVAFVLSDVTRGLFQTWFHGSFFPSKAVGVPSIGIPLSVVIIVEALLPSAISRFFEWNFLCYTGKISFSMYLLHPFVNFLPFLVELPRIDQFIVRIVLVYTLASVSYFLIENNCQRLAVALAKQLTQFSGSPATRVDLQPLASHA